MRMYVRGETQRHETSWWEYQDHWRLPKYTQYARESSVKTNSANMNIKLQMKLFKKSNTYKISNTTRWENVLCKR